MLSASPTAIDRLLNPSAVSALRFPELVRKTETSGALTDKKRQKAARKQVKTAISEARRQAGAANLYAVALTLTYENDEDFSSKHITRFVALLRQWLQRRGYALPYVWTLERAGRLHYHLMLWLPRGVVLDKSRLEKWWRWGTTWIESCRRAGAWGRYISKFEHVAVMPKNARLHGHGGLDEIGKAALRRARQPRWLQLRLPASEQARRVSHVGWVNTDSGEVYRSPYEWTPRGCIPRPRLRCDALPTSNF